MPGSNLFFNFNILHFIHSVLIKLGRQEIDISNVYPRRLFSNQLWSRGSQSLCAPTYYLPTPILCILRSLMALIVLLK